MHDLAVRLAETIGRVGPIPFHQWMEACLYDERDGFFGRGAGAGLAGRDFVTSPEVGSLFGCVGETQQLLANQVVKQVKRALHAEASLDSLRRLALLDPDLLESNAHPQTIYRPHR